MQERTNRERRSRFSKGRLCHRTSKTIIQKAQIYSKIKKAQQNKTGLTSCELECILRNLPDFLGCFSQDMLESLRIRSLPTSLIVNLDSSQEPGSHWIALIIRKKTLEIFDSFGLNFHKWPRVLPRKLFNFLHRFALRRRVFISRDIQSVTSTLCGFYCIYFLYNRLKFSFRDCTNHFSVTNLNINDDILVDSFK